MNTKAIALAFLIILTATTVSAQPPFGGGDRGGRGGGDRGGGGGDRGGRGGPSMGGGDRGGGSPFGGGDRSSRGGFDPSSFLTRLDANGNGVLDPDEQQGPAQFLIGRLQSMDPSIKSGSPIPIDKVKRAFEKMRGGSVDEGGGRDPRGSGPSAADDALMPELLVPGFGEDLASDPLMGFGAAAEMLAVPVTDDDRREAAERMRRYDRNGNGFVDKDELSSRFSGNPLDFDRNRDGKLSLDELAVRYARRREGEEEAKKENAKDKGRRERQSEVEVPQEFGDRKSYRVTENRRSPEGLPGYFTDKDANGDGQVSMAEFATEWNDEQIKAFFDLDFNRDGVITSDEAMRAVEDGPASAIASTSTSSTPSTPPAATGAPAAAGGKPDPKYVKYVQRIVSRYDANKDGSLTPSEYGEMLMSPADADANRDGRITVDEYAFWMQAKQKK